MVLFDGVYGMLTGKSKKRSLEPSTVTKYQIETYWLI